MIPAPRVPRTAFVKPHLPTHLTCTYSQYRLTRKGHFQADKRSSLQPKQHTNYRYAERGPTCHSSHPISEPKLTSVHPNGTGMMLCLLRQQVQLRCLHQLSCKRANDFCKSHCSSAVDLTRERLPSAAGGSRKGRETGSKRSRERNPQRSKINSWGAGNPAHTQTQTLLYGRQASWPLLALLFQQEAVPRCRTQRAGSAGSCWALLPGRQLALGASARHGILHLANHIPFEFKGWAGNKVLQKYFLRGITAKWTTPILDTPPYGFCVFTDSVKQRALL